MAYEKPSSSANQIDKAGKTFFNDKLGATERGAAIATYVFAGHHF
jgi:hypothetical protein